MPSTRFIQPMYDAVDALDLEGMLRWLTDDATSQLGNGPVLTGKADIRAGFAGFFATLEGMKHQMLATHIGETTVVLESLVTYTVRGGASVTVRRRPPWTSTATWSAPHGCTSTSGRSWRCRSRTRSTRQPADAPPPRPCPTAEAPIAGRDPAALGRRLAAPLRGRRRPAPSDKKRGAVAVKCGPPRCGVAVGRTGAAR